MRYQWCYCSLALSHRYVLPGGVFSLTVSICKSELCPHLGWQKYMVAFMKCWKVGYNHLKLNYIHEKTLLVVTYSSENSEQKSLYIKNTTDSTWVPMPNVYACYAYYTFLEFLFSHKRLYRESAFSIHGTRKHRPESVVLVLIAVDSHEAIWHDGRPELLVL